MSNHEFTLVLDREPSEDEYDRLFEAGCDDGSPETRNGGAVVHFDRKAPSLTHALVTAIHDVESVGFLVQAVETDDLVSLRTIATRLDRGYEGMRLIATGKRGPGGFPPALSGDGWSLYSWSQVADWSRKHLNTGNAVATFEIQIAAADHVVRARNMLREDEQRAEFAQLLSA